MIIHGNASCQRLEVRNNMTFKTFLENMPPERGQEFDGIATLIKWYREYLAAGGKQEFWDGMEEIGKDEK